MTMHTISSVKTNTELA